MGLIGNGNRCKLNPRLLVGYFWVDGGSFGNVHGDKDIEVMSSSLACLEWGEFVMLWVDPPEFLEASEDTELTDVCRFFG